MPKKNAAKCVNFIYSVLDLEIGKKKKLVYYEIAWSQLIRWLFLRKLVLFLCNVWGSDCFEFLPVVAIYRLLGNIVRVTNTDESLTMCHNMRANEKTRFHYVQWVLILSDRVGHWILVLVWFICVFYFFDVETQSQVSVLFHEKASKRDQCR